MYFGGSGQHSSGYERVQFNSGPGHDLSQRLHLLSKVLQLLVDHGAKYSLDLTLLQKGREGGRDGGREGGRDGGREGWREGGMEGARDGGRG